MRIAHAKHTSRPTIDAGLPRSSMPRRHGQTLDATCPSSARCKRRAWLGKAGRARRGQAGLISQAGTRQISPTLASTPAVYLHHNDRLLVRSLRAVLKQSPKATGELRPKVEVDRAGATCTARTVHRVLGTRHSQLDVLSGVYARD